VEEIERRVTAFFTYLDSREYVKAFELEGGCYGNMCSGGGAVGQPAEGGR